MNFELANKLTELLEVKKLDEAIEVAEDELNKIPKTDFHKIIGKNLKHLTAVLKKYIADFDRATTNELRKKQGFFKSIFGSGKQVKQ
jgi:predicted phage-related endonuclease